MRLTTGGDIKQHLILRQQFLYFQPNYINPWLYFQMIGDLIRVSFDIITPDILESMIGEGNKIPLFIFEQFLPDTIRITTLIYNFSFHLSTQQ